MHVCFQIAQYYLTVTYSPPFSSMKAISEALFSQNIKSTEVGLFMLVKQQRSTITVAEGGDVEI